MNILLQGYFDRNFGDDLMMKLVMEQLGEYSFYAPFTRSELMGYFADVKNLHPLPEASMHFDSLLRVTGSGFLIRSNLGTMYTLSRIYHMAKDRENVDVRAVIGCNIGPFKNTLAEKVTLREIREYDFITVRDIASSHFLAAHHVKSKNSIYPDIVFSLPAKSIPTPCGECLGISTYRRMGIDNMPLYRALATAADDFIERTGKDVLLFAFDVEDENDLCAAHTVQSLCRHADKTQIVWHNKNAILEGFARCSQIVAVRFHSAVLALRMGIPFVPVVYSPKTDNMLDDMKYTGARIAIDKIDAEILIDAIKRATAPFVLPGASFEAAKRHAASFKEFLETAKR